MGLVLNAATQTFTGVNCGTNQTNQWGEGIFFLACLPTVYFDLFADR
jgi:hypothetical protein